MAIYCVNHTEPIHKICGQNVQCFFTKSDCTYTNYYGLSG